MSAAEIADNKWEAESTKPPIITPGGLAQILLMGLFGLFFVFILINSVIAIVTPHQESDLESQYKEKLGSGEGAPAEAPAAE